MNAVVVSHGKIEDFQAAKRIMEDCDILVCADGGAEYALKCGLIPDVLVGDLDSIDAEVLEKLNKSKCRVMRYPREKDYTDTQLAVDYAIGIGAKDITLLGSVGDRLDHTLANIFLLVKLDKQNITARVVNEKNIICITSSQKMLKGNKGDTVSLIPVGGDVDGIYTNGLMYKLSGQSIAMGDPLGISNVFIGEDADIRVESGLLLVIKSRD